MSVSSTPAELTDSGSFVIKLSMQDRVWCDCLVGRSIRHWKLLVSNVVLNARVAGRSFSKSMLKSPQ